MKLTTEIKIIKRPSDLIPNELELPKNNRATCPGCNQNYQVKTMDWSHGLYFIMRLHKNKKTGERCNYGGQAIQSDCLHTVYTDCQEGARLFTKYCKAAGQLNIYESRNFLRRHQKEFYDHLNNCPKCNISLAWKEG